MLGFKAAARLPDRLAFIRNGRVAETTRIRLNEITIDDNRLKIADAAYEGRIPPIPVRVPNGKHVVHIYQWNHPRGLINVCAVVAFNRQRLAGVRQLKIANDTRPDITDGFIVDSGEVRIGSESGVSLESGLGDGCYPVIAVYNFGLFLQAVVVDFKVWKVRNVVLLPGQEFDEFAIVRRVG